MKNEDKGKNKGKLKYIGVVVVVAFLAGIYLVSATTVITDIQMTLEKVGVGNTRIGGGFIEVDDSSGSPIFCVNSTSGNVGIGTADPQGLLQVGEGTFVVTQPCNNVGIDETTPEAKLEITPGTTTKDLLMLSSTASADGDRFIVKNDGKVGIGITTPWGKLDVSDGTGADMRGIIIKPIAGDMVKFQHHLGQAAQDFAYVLGPGPIVSFPGKVGIGTTSPARKLHVNDVMRLEPRAAAPPSPSEGDIYVNSTDHHIYCCLGTPNCNWKQLD